MRVIRPRALSASERRRGILFGLTMLAAGVLAAELAVVSTPPPLAAGVIGGSAAMGLGVGTAWLVRVLRPNRSRAAAVALVDLLASAFDDTYTLLAAPRLPVRDAERLDGVLIGPAGVRVLTTRDWHGRYRVRGRLWEFDAGRRGWIACRTNPSFEAAGLATGFARWASERGFAELPVRPAVVFAHRRSQVVLEEPEDEVVTADNTPWWANALGRVRRLDEATAARLAAAIIEGAEQPDTPSRQPEARHAL